jgi:hypothetical protein
MVLIHGPYDAPDVDRVMIVPSLPAHDPLLQHLALVLQAAVEGEGVAGQLYADTLADALVMHFLKRYAAVQPSQQEASGHSRLAAYPGTSWMVRPIMVACGALGALRQGDAG